MKEAIGNTMVFNLMMIFIVMMFIILLGSVTYSKGFKIRNRIIDRIEQYHGYDPNGAVVTAINEDLKAVGYRIVANQNCHDRPDASAVLTSEYNAYNYCVYQYDTNRGTYYGVKVYVYIDFPFIGKFASLPLYGESEIVYQKGTVEY